MVHQAAPGEKRFWSIPSGRVEPDELVVEGLARELREETGLELVDPGALAFVLQLDNRRREPPGRARGPEGGYLATVWTFDVHAWTGELASRDPDGVVTDARFVATPEAIERLTRLEWQRTTVAYLRGELEPGTLVLERWHADGSIERLAVTGRGQSASGSRQRTPG